MKKSWNFSLIRVADGGKLIKDRILMKYELLVHFRISLDYFEYGWVQRFVGGSYVNNE